ncbi:MAG: EamA family transporter [Thermomicrobiales bacterium]|nr:EamA family transporter [Thermomicrobiales bacterium]MCO5225463.1 EamA family transporter [Thermomicrobiales bacterium]
MHTPTRGALPWLALLTIWTVWGSTYLGMKIAVETIPPFLMTAMRFFFAAPILFAFAVPALKRGEIRVSARQVRSAALIGFLLLLGGTGLGALAQRYLDSSFAALMVSLSPIWMSTFTALRTHKRPDSKVIGALVVGLIGIVIMVGGPGSGHISLFGVMLILTSSLAWSYGTVESRFRDLPHNSFVSSTLQMIAGGIALMTLSFSVGEWGELDVSSISTRSWFAFAWLVLAGSVLAYSAYMYANRTLPIEVVSTYAYVNPVLAVVLGAWLDNDPIGPNVIIGGAVILSAVVFIVSGHRTRRGPIDAEK